MKKGFALKCEISKLRNFLWVAKGFGKNQKQNVIVFF